MDMLAFLNILLTRVAVGTFSEHDSNVFKTSYSHVHHCLNVCDVCQI